jgi:hypothetical protein
MNVVQALRHLQESGIEISIDGEKLRASRILEDEEVRSFVKAHRDVFKAVVEYRHLLRRTKAVERDLEAGEGDETEFSWLLEDLEEKERQLRRFGLSAEEIAEIFAGEIIGSEHEK